MAKNEISPNPTNAKEILDIDELKKQAEQGDAEAQCNLGLCYETGKKQKQSICLPLLTKQLRFWLQLFILYHKFT